MPRQIVEVEIGEYSLLKSENAKLKEKIKELETRNELLKTPLDVAKDCELMCQTDLWGKEDLRELYQHLIVMCSNME